MTSLYKASSSSDSGKIRRGLHSGPPQLTMNTNIIVLIKLSPPKATGLPGNLQKIGLFFEGS